MIVSAILGGGAAAKLLKPKKGILPIPLPIPIPFPIEWEQPPVVIHPKKEIVSVASLDERSEEKRKTTTTSTTTVKPETDYNDDEWNEYDSDYDDQRDGGHDGHHQDSHYDDHPSHTDAFHSSSSSELSLSQPALAQPPGDPYLNAYGDPFLAQVINNQRQQLQLQQQQLTQASSQVSSEAVKTPSSPTHNREEDDDDDDDEEERGKKRKTYKIKFSLRDDGKKKGKI